MKPRLIKNRGIWLCALIGAKTECIGYGFDPLQAYEDWLWLTYKK